MSTLRGPSQLSTLACLVFLFAGTATSVAAAPTPAAPPTLPPNVPGTPNLPAADGTPANTGLKGQSAPAAANSSSANGHPPVQAGAAVADQAFAAKGNTPQSAEKGKTPATVEISGTDVVNLHVNDEELANVLEMLSIQSERNIVASKNVSARITANLYGVTFTQALDAILHVNGYGYIEKDNFIYVYTLDELRAIEAAQRQTVWKTVTLNYITATDAAEFVKPLLSEKGQIKTNGKTENFTLGAAGPSGKNDFAGVETLAVFDYEENVAEIEKLVKQVDTRPAQVLIEATILQTSLNEANALGVDFSILSDLNFIDFSKTGPLKVVDGLISGAGERLDSTGATTKIPLPGDGNGKALQSTPGNTSGPGTFKLGIATKDVAVFLSMLDEVSDTTILSNPKIFTLNRMPARVLVGRKVGYLNTTSTDTTTTQTVQFLDTGTQLNVRPFVTSDGVIRMELKPQVSEAVIRDTKDSTGSTVTIPDEITNELTTNVMVRDGQTIVLGGLFRESTTSSRRQVPWLGDVPIIGNAFKGRDDNTQRSEIIFLITPSIVNDAFVADAGAKGKDYAEKVRTGSREGVLWWSRDRMSSNLNVAAQRLAAEGDTEKALWKLNQSLRMNPTQPEALALREKISGKSSALPSRSVLNTIINTEGAKKSSQATPAGEPSANNNTPNTSTAAPAETQSHANAEAPAQQMDETPAQPASETPAQPASEAVPAEQNQTPAEPQNNSEPSASLTPAVNVAQIDLVPNEVTATPTLAPGQGVFNQDWQFDVATATAQDWSTLWDFSQSATFDFFADLPQTDAASQLGSAPSEPMPAEAGER